MAAEPVKARHRISASPGAGVSSSLPVDVRRSAYWVAGSTVLMRSVNFLSTAVVAHILSPHDFGVFAVALTVYSIVYGITELGGASCLRLADLDIDRLAPTVMLIAPLINMVLSAVLVAFAHPIASALGSVQAVSPVRVLAAALLLSGIFAAPLSQMVRNFQQKEIFAADATGLAASTTVLLVLAERGNGPMAFAWSVAVNALVRGMVLYALVPRRYMPGIQRGAVAVICRFGMPLAGANFVHCILLNVDYVFVGHLAGARSLGIYTLAFTIASWPVNLLAGLINNLSMPAVSRAKRNPAVMEDAVAAAVRGVSLIAMPLCGLTVALAHPIILTLYGGKWAGAANVLAILAFYGVIVTICYLIGTVIAGLGRTELIFGLQLAWVLLLAPSLAVAVRREGIMGAALAHVAVIGPVVLPMYILALRKVSGVPFAVLVKAARPALLASSAAAVLAHGAALQFRSPLSQLAAGLTAGVTVYGTFTARQAIALLGGGYPIARVLRPYRGAHRRCGAGRRGRQ
jgi:lipopolysaccharide exporter